MPTDKQKLRFNYQLLQDHRTLHDYNIPDGATITLGRMNVHVPLMLYDSSHCSLQNGSVSLALIVTLYTGHNLVKVVTDLLYVQTNLFLRNPFLAVTHVRAFRYQ